MKLRRFNEAGIKAFREELALLRANPDRDPNPQLLEHREFTELVQPEIQVAQEFFRTKAETARYLTAVLGKIPAVTVERDAGLWSWLSLFYFDSVCNRSQGKWNVKNDYFYIFAPGNVRHFYRHLLFISWHMLRLTPDFHRLFLSGPVATLPKVISEVAMRLYITRIPAIFEVLDRLYWDETRKRHKVGITDTKVHAGDLTHRFPTRIRQLEKTYDLMSLDADQLLELLGEEFSFARTKSATLFDHSMV